MRITPGRLRSFKLRPKNCKNPFTILFCRCLLMNGPFLYRNWCSRSCMALKPMPNCGTPLRKIKRTYSKNLALWCPKILKKPIIRTISCFLSRMFKEMEKIINLEAIEVSIEKELISNKKNINECKDFM